MRQSMRIARISRIQPLLDRHFSTTSLVGGTNHHQQLLSNTATQTASSVQQQQTSFRTKLKSTSLDTNLLHFLDDNKLGYLTTRRTRKKVAEHYRAREELEGQTSSSSTSSSGRQGISQKIIRKYPFNKPAKRIIKLDEWKPELLQGEYKILPQVAIVGRSNVGKSTLLNYLCGLNASFIQKSPMSEKPGETKSLVFYHVGKSKIPNNKSITVANHNKSKDKEKEKERKVPFTTSIIENTEKVEPEHSGIMLVDMPGYGFAFMNENDTTRCHTLSMQYLLSSMSLPQIRLQRVMLLLDARHGLKQTDATFLHQLYEEYLAMKPKSSHKLRWKLQIVLTKCDLVERITLCKLMTILKKDILDRFPSRFIHDLPIIPISVKEEKGIGNLLSSLYPIVHDPFVTSSPSSSSPTRSKS